MKHTGIIRLVLAVGAVVASSAWAQQANTNKDTAGVNTGGAAKARSGKLLYAPTYEECLQSGRPVVTRTNIYHDGWIDLNKNGTMDV